MMIIDEMTLVASLPETAPFWEHAEHSVLAFPRCTECEMHFFYPRPFCPRCWSRAVEWLPVSGRGVLSSFVIVERAPADAVVNAPYVVALVELEEGVRLMANLVDVEPAPEALPLDLELEVTFRREPWGVARPVFRPRAR